MVKKTIKLVGITYDGKIFFDTLPVAKFTPPKEEFIKGSAKISELQIDDRKM